MKFLVDAQLPPALAVWLRDAGHMADHVATLGMVAAADRDLADLAMAIDAILVSKDADFVLLRLPDRFSFVWLRCGNASNIVLQRWFEPRLPRILQALEAGERFLEVRLTQYPA